MQRLRASLLHGSDSLGGQGLQNFLIHISELLDVYAALAGGVLAEFRQHRLGVAGCIHAIQNIGGLPRRKTDERHIALTPALVFVVVAAEANNRWPPQLRLLPRRSLHVLDESLRVRAADWIREGIDKCRHAQLGGFGFVFRHILTLVLSKVNLRVDDSLLEKQR